MKVCFIYNQIDKRTPVFHFQSYIKIKLANSYVIDNEEKYVSNLKIQKIKKDTIRLTWTGIGYWKYACNVKHLLGKKELRTEYH